MRSELKQIELADLFLLGYMAPADREAFESRLTQDHELRELVEDQKALMQGMEKLGLRIAVDSAYRSYRWQQIFPWITGIIVVAVTTGSYLMLSSQNAETDQVHEIYPTEVTVPAGSSEPKEHGSAVIVHDDTSAVVTATDERQDYVITDTVIRKEVRMLYNDGSAITESDPVEVRADYTEADPVPSEVLISGEAIKDPEFPGGMTEMRWYIYKNLQIPEGSNGKPWNGTVKVDFTIMPDGTVADVKARRSPNREAMMEAERVITSMPKWKPGTRGGAPVQSRIEVPIVFMSGMETMN